MPLLECSLSAISFILSSPSLVGDYSHEVFLVLFLFQLLELLTHQGVVARAPYEVICAFVVLEVAIEPLRCALWLHYLYDLYGRF